MTDAFTLYNITVIFSFYNPTADICIRGMFESNVSAVSEEPSGSDSFGNIGTRFQAVFTLVLLVYTGVFTVYQK